MYRAYKANIFVTSKVPEIFGENLEGKDKSMIEIKSIFGPNKIVGIYFSASWCSPCRQFTPRLAEFYTTLKAKNPNFEIIFASDDYDERMFEEYFEEMPWLAFPYKERDLVEKLTYKYNIQALPSLVIIDGQTGDVITKNGRSEVIADPEGTEFPWKTKSFLEIIPGQLVNNKDEEKDALEAIKGKYIGIFFSAEWSQPCKEFTTRLAKTYDKIKSDGENFEVIYVTLDIDEKSYKEHLSEMPWLAIPYGDSRVGKLKKKFGLVGLPSLVIVDDYGKIIKQNGADAVYVDPDGEEFPWPPKPVNRLRNDTADKLNEGTCLVLFSGDSEDEIKKSECLLEDIGKLEFSKGESQDLFVFYALDGDDMTKITCEFTDFDNKTNRLAIFDIMSNKKYICTEKTISKETIADFVKEYRENNTSGVKIR